MVKRFSYIILSVLLLISTMGIAVSKHYCESSFISVSLFSEAKSCCGTGDCCHNENHFFQVKADYSAPPISDIPETLVIDLLLSDQLASVDPITTEDTDNKIIYNDLPPPPKIQESLALKQAYLL